MPISLVEAIVERRTDLDRAERREVIESIRSKDLEADYTELANPTIFSRITFSTSGFMDRGLFFGF
ncbi:hypothetical protein L0F63_003174 [Massospora cicadina]|nr:hypothetical protein L0F63_003174 [Massospora cicadina]